MVFELLISPLTISNNYFGNSIIIGLIGIIAFKVAFKIVRDAYSQNEVMKEEVKCPKCNSKNISVLKGDGFSIIGADYIAIICNDCKKIYGFNDVKYKTNCPKEL